MDAATGPADPRARTGDSRSLTERIFAAARRGTAGWPVLAESHARLRESGDSRSRRAALLVAARSDPGLALALLQRANMAERAAERVAGVEAAIERLDRAALVALADTLVPYDPLKESELDAVRPDRIRMHACAVRDIAERLMRESGRQSGDWLRTAALVHDAGKLVLVRELPWYDPHADDVPEQRVARERAEIGVDHARVGAAAASACGLPAEAVHAVADHHRRDAAEGASLIRVADMLAHYREGRPIDIRALRDATAAIGLTPEALGALMYDLADPLAARAEPRQPSPLSRRELEVLRGLAEGKLYKEIATDLSVSPATVRNHLHKAYGKLGVRDRAQAVLVARGRGWL